MKMKDQVTSIEQSKRLIEIGVPAEKASMVWVPDYKFDSNTREFISTGSYEICPKHRVFDVVKEDVIPAFTVADLLGIIKSINVFGNPIIEKIGDARWRFEFGAITGELEYGFNECQNIVELLVGRIEWMVSNGYELNI
jgi:hypothetical protein|uniref:Uncharacterized protein n=1 Tax=Siphoviridae sp. ctqpo8 TaxID=2826469 RepID=A0A8S5M2V4_9CAUD|nr:MAG TPA: hypothetical protein [Siphoviridae sp. ctqpo8]